MMKKFKKVTILLVFLMLVSICLVGFAEEKEFTFARPEDILFMDPYDMNEVSGAIINKLIYNFLVNLDPETGVGYVPDLATEWSVSPDGTEYTFKLRQGVKFHNGEPFNAECVKESLERFLHENLRRGVYWDTLKEVKIVDDYTVIVGYEYPNALCLDTLSSEPILPPKAFKEKGVALFDHPIGTGAFTFVEWKRGLHLICEKNPDYWGKPAYIDKFVYLPIMEGSTRLAGILTGEIDVADVMTGDQIPVAEAEPNVEIVKILGWDQNYIGLRNKPPMTDKKFREAINLAVDRENIVKFVLKGGRPATGPIPKGIFGFDNSLIPVKRDIEKAKQLVKESIYDGRELDFIVPVGWYPKSKEVVQALQAELIEVGINVKLDIIEGASYKEKRSAGNYDFYFTGWGMTDVDSLYFNVILSDYHSTGFKNEELNKLIKDQRQETNSEKRIGILRKIENIINTEVFPEVFLYQLEKIYFQRKGVKGIVYYGNGIPDLRYAHYEE